MKEKTENREVLDEKNHHHEEDGCCCGHGHHDHDHEHDHHEHEEECCCGHDHHDHDHDHEHAHHDHDHEHDHHDHEEECCCGHDHHEHDHHEHEEECCCGHDHHDHEHEHHHHDGDECCCGHDHHDHEHHHHDGDDCCCGHDHHHEEETKVVDHSFDNVAKQVYIIDNLACAHCAAKMESKIKEMPEVEYANIIFATKQLQVVTNTDRELLPEFEKICQSIESEVTIKKRDRNQERKEAQPKGKLAENKKDFVEIGIGVLFFIGGTVVKDMSVTISLVLYLIGYLILGHNVVISALKNIGKGQVFDENFLMSIATIGAFFIGEFTEAVGVMLFYRIGELFEQIAVARSRSQIMEAVDLRPEVVNRVTGDTTEEIPAEDAKIGDILIVRPGDRIPLDGTIIEGESRLDTSPVTGEPVLAAVSEGSEILSGCVNTSGLLKMRVDQELENSMVTRILDSVENAAASKPKIDRFITRFSRVYTPIVVILAAATAIIPSLFSGNWEYWIYTALTFLVISCPCALVLSVPLAFFAGIGAGSKKKILFKGGVALEALKDVKAIVMDKTGTITEGRFAVQDVIAENGIDKDELLAAAASCEMRSTHPIATSIVDAAAEKGLKVEAPKSVEEISGKGVKVYFEKGTAFCGNRLLLEENGINIPKEDDVSYGTEVLLAVNGTFAGRIVIADAIKEDAKHAISRIKKLNIRTAMLTGDGEGSAKTVAEVTGIDDVYAKLLPHNKVEKLQEIRKKHGSVMFVGDGMNDAPVLAGADVGAAMGSGTDAAIEAADVVFMTSSMDAIPESLKIAKTTANIAKQNVIFALTIKAFVILLGFLHMANMWMAVFADTGVAMICILNSVRILYKK